MSKITRNVDLDKKYQDLIKIGLFSLIIIYLYDL